MSILERLQRVIAILIGLVALLGGLYLTLYEPDPRKQSIGVICFRMSIYGLASFFFIRRAAGKKIAAGTWVALTFASVLGSLDWTVGVASAIKATFTALVFVAALIEQRLERAAQPRVAADGPAPRR